MCYVIPRVKLRWRRIAGWHRRGGRASRLSGQVSARARALARWQMLCGAPIPGGLLPAAQPQLVIATDGDAEAPPLGPTAPKRPKAQAEGGDREEAKRHKADTNEEAAVSKEAVSATDDQCSWHKECRSTPSGRRLRDVQGWAESGVKLSSDSDCAARLLDLAAEMVLGVFGDPYGERARHHAHTNCTEQNHSGGAKDLQTVTQRASPGRLCTIRHGGRP